MRIWLNTTLKRKLTSNSCIFPKFILSSQKKSMQNLNPNIIQNFSNNSETLIKSKYSNTEEVISTLENNLEKGFITETEFLSSLNTVKSLSPTDSERIDEILDTLEKFSIYFRKNS